MNVATSRGTPVTVRHGMCKASRDNHMRTCAILLLVLVVAVTTGCATGPPRSSAPQSQPQPQAQPQPRINLTGYSAAFKQGYADGCESAQSLLTRKDGRRFQSDADYAMGWRDGYSICERRGR